MDAGAREVLENLVRSTIAADLDALEVEVAELRRDLEAAKERAAGLATPRVPRDERLRVVAELRAQGFSAAVIAARVGAHRMTVARDLREIGAPSPATTLGRDGVVRRHRAAS